MRRRSLFREFSERFTNSKSRKRTKATTIRAEPGRNSRDRLLEDCRKPRRSRFCAFGYSARTGKERLLPLKLHRVLFERGEVVLGVFQFARAQLDFGFKRGDEPLADVQYFRFGFQASGNLRSQFRRFGNQRVNEVCSRLLSSRLELRLQGSGYLSSGLLRRWSVEPKPDDWPCYASHFAILKLTVDIGFVALGQLPADARGYSLKLVRLSARHRAQKVPRPRQKRIPAGHHCGNHGVGHQAFKRAVGQVLRRSRLRVLRKNDVAVFRAEAQRLRIHRTNRAAPLVYRPKVREAFVVRAVRHFGLKRRN